METNADLVCEFLEVAIHMILYIREVYPAAIFERKSKYGIPVRISRHPELSEYINEVVCSLHPAIVQGDPQKIVVAIVEPDTASHPAPLGRPRKPHVVERFVFELGVLDALDDQTVMEQHFVAFLMKISTSVSMLPPNPKGCTVSILLYTNRSSKADWIPVEYSMDLERPDIVPLRSMDAKGVQMQLFVEHRPELLRPTS